MEGQINRFQNFTCQRVFSSLLTVPSGAGGVAVEWGGIGMALLIIWVKLREAYKEMARDLTESDGAGGVRGVRGGAAVARG